MKPSARYGYWAGAMMALIVVAFFFVPGQEAHRSIGPANTGHESLECGACHVSAPGTMRQQVQANLRYQLGQRSHPVDFQNQPITNDTCLECHARPTDSHPVFRFNEPRFAQARADIQPQLCVSCHLEHEGKRVTIEPGFCSHCHQDLELKNDPLDVTHTELVMANNWNSCLGCHDFHGNHLMELATELDQALDIEEILTYFEGSPSPYANEKLYSAKEQTP